MPFRGYNRNPWEGGPSFASSNYARNYGGNEDVWLPSLNMNDAYSYNQEEFRDFHSLRYLNEPRSPSYGRYWRNSRGGRNAPHNWRQNERVSRSPLGRSGSKRSNPYNERQHSKHTQWNESYKGREQDRLKRKNESSSLVDSSDFSDDEFEGYEIYKSSSEECKGSIKEKEEQTGKDDNSSIEKLPLKKYICYVCKVICFHKHELEKHDSSQQHTSKINELLVIQKQKKEEAKKEESSKKNFCKTCNAHYDGIYSEHCFSNEHSKEWDKQHPKCRACKLSFNSREDYDIHIEEENHKKRSAELHFWENLPSNCDDDLEAIESFKDDYDYDVVEKIEDESIDLVKTEKIDVDQPVKIEEGKSDESAKVKNADTEVGEQKETDTEKVEGDNKKDAYYRKRDSKRHRESKGCGSSFIVSVDGYFCKLCKKFFKSSFIAKHKHVKSVMHVKNFEEGMQAAFLQEEERQKKAKEKLILDQKAAEASKLASEIDAVKKSAKKAAIRELAKKKHTKKSQVKDKAKEKKEEICAATGTTIAKPENDPMQISSTEVQFPENSVDKHDKISEEIPENSVDEHDKITEEIPDDDEPAMKSGDENEAS